ncbi:MAG: hypothetical protein ACK5LV_07550 [Lachnospirales bacterium]
MAECYSSGVLFRFVIGDFDIDKHNNIFRALKLYALNVIPEKFIRENKEVYMEGVEALNLIDYYNEFMKFTLKGIAINPEIVPNSNLVYDFVTILKADSTEINICFSYTNIFIVINSSKKCLAHDVLTNYLHTKFQSSFKKGILEEVNRNAEHFEFDYDLFEPVARNLLVYNLPSDQYPVNFRPVLTEDFDANSKSNMARLFDNREKITRVFATYGSLAQG